jgi:hypothetical protein
MGMISGVISMIVGRQGEELAIDYKEDILLCCMSAMVHLFSQVRDRCPMHQRVESLRAVNWGVRVL